MAEKTLKQIQESLIDDFKKDYPDERLYGKVFSLYILSRHARLLLKIYEKAKK